jgi:non-ribosomal peptide synthetase-like protein
MIPVDGEVREDVGFLGSPNFEIPRMVLRDRKFDYLKSGDEMTRRLAGKNKHNIVTMGLFLLKNWGFLFGSISLFFGTVALYPRLGTFGIVVGLILALLFGLFYNIFVERAAAGFQALRPKYCSIYESEFWPVERYWKLNWQPFFLDGTPFKVFAWRLLGVRIGKRVFDDGCLMMDKTMITIGDDCVINAGTIIQPHSQEDGVFKSDRIKIGAGCTIGVGALVHYGVTMGDGASLAADAFLMKGEEVPPHTHWEENPAREVQDNDAVEAAVPVAAPLLQVAGNIAVTVNGETTY